MWYFCETRRDDMGLRSGDRPRVCIWDLQWEVPCPCNMPDHFSPHDLHGVDFCYKSITSSHELHKYATTQVQQAHRKSLDWADSARDPSALQITGGVPYSNKDCSRQDLHLLSGESWITNHQVHRHNWSVTYTLHRCGSTPERNSIPVLAKVDQRIHCCTRSITFITKNDFSLKMYVRRVAVETFFSSETVYRHSGVSLTLLETWESTME